MGIGEKAKQWEGGTEVVAMADSHVQGRWLRISAVAASRLRC